MNVADTDRMELLLFQSGYVRTPRKDEADLVLVNTCSVREKAEQKIYSLMGGFRPLKIANPDLILGLTGCLAQQEGDRLIKKMPFLDFILGPDTIEEILSAIHHIQNQGEPIVWTSFDTKKNYSIPKLQGRTPGLNPEPSAFVNIIKGCDKFCSFCIVPLTRGREKSREADEICDEVRQRVESGAREIVLLGQNVNSYGKRGLHTPVPFHELLYRVAEIPGLQRLRFTTSHPKDFTRETVRAYRELDVLMNHLHLPVQCGNDRVLERMRRGYSVEEYRDLVDALKSAVPDIALSTDIIVGFPGETDREFQDTLELMDRVGFDNSYMFSYSPRPFTPAAELEDSVPEHVKKERLQATIDLQKQITLRNGRKFIGQVVDVLIEGRTTRHEASFKGRTPQYWMVNFSGGEQELKPGDCVKVKLLETLGHVFRGEYLNQYVPSCP